MKLGHFNTVFRASLLLFASLCSFVALSDGSCHLEQFGDGTFRIVCEGGTIVYTQEIITNNVYIVQNCEELKHELLSAVYSVNDVLMSTDSYLQHILSSAEQIWYSTSSDQIGLYIRSQVEEITNDVRLVRSDLSEVSYGLVGGSGTSTLTPLSSLIDSIECGSCSTNIGGSSCCDVDLTPILRQMNEAQLALISITNSLGFYVGGISNPFARMNWNNSTGKFNFGSSNQILANNNTQRNVINLLSLMHHNLVNTQASINNYLRYFAAVQIPNISNNLEVVMWASSNLLDVTTVFYVESTNHFSFFREMTFQDSPLTDFGQQSTFDSYYDFLTNHYLKISFKQYNDLVGDEKEKTNWFSRVETLLAALVFNDSDGTNTVDDSFGQSQRDNLINSLDGMTQTSTTQVDLMSDMGDSLLSSLRSLNSSFSSAVSMPGEVKLATVGQDNSMSSNTIKFQSSEISQLVEACRCATTLAWCFGGIWLLFLFVSWSIKTSYSLCVFCWSVVSAIFGGGKT